MSNRPRLKLGRRTLLLHGAAAATVFHVPALWAQASPSPELTSRIKRALGSVLSIDNHTHLLTPAPPYSRQADAGSPLLLRSTRPEMVEVLRSRFGIACARPCCASIVNMRPSTCCTMTQPASAAMPRA